MDTVLILLDMDGVLTDFAAASCALFGVEPPGPDRAGVDLPELCGVSSGLFWKRIDDAGLAFWEHLPPTEHADALVALVRSRGDLAICTSPARAPASAAGKVKWLQRRLGRNFRDFAITPMKHLLAAPGRALVDDTAKHVDAFNAGGGVGVLFPTWGNGERSADADPVAVVEAALAHMETDHA
jgi:hypothetical protein